MTTEAKAKKKAGPINWDDELFRVLWERETKVEDMGKIFGCMKSTIIRRAQSLGYGPRTEQYKRAAAKHVAKMAHRELHPKKKMPDLEPRGPFTKERDQMIFDSNGTYVALAELADTWGASLTAIQQRFHMLRKQPRRGSDG